MARFEISVEIALKGCLHRRGVIYEKKKAVKDDADVWHLTNQINANIIYYNGA